MTEMNRQLP